MEKKRNSEADRRRWSIRGYDHKFHTWVLGKQTGNDGSTENALKRLLGYKGAA